MKNYLLLLAFLFSGISVFSQNEIGLKHTHNHSPFELADIPQPIKVSNSSLSALQVCVVCEPVDLKSANHVNHEFSLNKVYDNKTRKTLVRYHRYKKDHQTFQIDSWSTPSSVEIDLRSK